MANNGLDISKFLSCPPFKLPNVRSSFNGNVVHIGFLVGDSRLRAACHSDSNKITMAQPTADMASCLNCLARERRGKIPPSVGIEMTPTVIRSALSIWRSTTGELRAAVDKHTLRRLWADLDDTEPRVPALPRLPEWLADELIGAFTLYQQVADGAVVTELVTEVVAKMWSVVFPEAVEHLAAA